MSANKRNFVTTLNFDYSRAGIFCIGVVFTLVTITALATDITWNGSVSDDWDNPTNWTPQTVPTSSDHVFLNDGYVTVPLDASFSVMDWSGGTVSGVLTVSSNAVLNMTGENDKGCDSVVLTNNGTIVWSGGDLIIGDNAIYNQAGALFDIQNNQTIYVSAGASINNAGLIRKSAGGGETGFEPQVNNTGTLEVQSGRINLWGGYSGTTTANLAISIGGTSAPNDYGLINSDSTLILGGRFTVTTRNGFRPNPGDSFYVLNYTSAVGDFVCMDGVDQGGGLRLAPQFSATGLTLTAITYPTNSLPNLGLLRSAQGFLVVWPPEFTGWQLYSTTNLATHYWSTVAVPGTNNTIVPIIGSEFYFQARKTNQ